MQDLKVTGKVRGLIPDLNLVIGREDEQVHVNGQGELIVANAGAMYREVNRIGRMFKVQNTAAVAAVTSLPTTACILGLYNNEPDGGRSYIIDQVYALITTDTVNVSAASIIAAISPVREAIPTASALVPTTLNSSGKLDTRARTVIGTTVPATTGFAGNWMPTGPSNAAAVAALPGWQIVHPIDGRIVIMPGRYFALHVLATHTTISAQCGIIWHENYITQG